MLTNGQCATEVAEQVADGRVLSWEEIAELIGAPSRQAAEMSYQRAIVAFVRTAREMGLNHLVDRFVPRRAGLFDSSR